MIAYVYHGVYTHRCCIATLIRGPTSRGHLRCGLERNLKSFMRFRRAHISAHEFTVGVSSPDLFALFENAELARMFILLPVSISGKFELALASHGKCNEDVQILLHRICYDGVFIIELSPEDHVQFSS